MSVYYNENDSFAAAWLRELVKAGHISPGEVDERSIEDVIPADILGFTQCHFFAGIGVWSYALRRAGWPDDRPVWTGSCPCQPFSAAGKGGGFADERHLWPAFYHLISQCRPVTIFGEQVASKDGICWFDLVCADMEEANYAIGAVDTCAAGFGAPHIRQRLYWVAHAKGGESRAGFCDPRQGGQRRHIAPDGSAAGGLDNPIRKGLERYSRHGHEEAGWSEQAGSASAPGSAGRLECTRPTDGFWRDADWLLCRDGRWRPVEPGLEPLAHGAAARVGRLRGYGNAIVAPQAEAFIRAYLEVIGNRQ
ncbi:DNA cytosine methyltransferase [uncultured Desulfovibrio sp.]|uniref:DNA cytosine methyltransferase n=1 Tax=uncultured Desulfovibrio sp. TaxID=167968 RepID=UPI00262B1807|nr:DNA cytosine methyltransferase [uncultured Desulfovibrio sp.]